MLPIVRVKSVEEGIALSQNNEHNYQAHRDHPFARRGKHHRDGACVGHDVVHEERTVGCGPRPGGEGYLSSHRHADGRRYHESENVHARRRCGGGQPPDLLSHAARTRVEGNMVCD